MNTYPENERNIHRDNRKYAVRFVAIVLLSATVGAVFGYCSNGVLPQDVRTALDAGSAALTRNAPWLLAGTLLLGAAICLTLVLRARAALNRWDGEDERACNAIENRLNWVLCASNLMMVLSMLLSLCDERERQQIGQANYAAFRAFNVLCPALWLLLMIGNLLSDGWLGVAPAIVVAILWGTASTVYVIASIRLEKLK